MKKKAILSFAAAAAICAASAGSYAAWDNTKAVSSGTIAVASRINVTSNAMGAFSGTHEMSQAPIYDADATFDLSSVESTLRTNLNFELTVSVKNGETAVDNTAYTVSVTPKGGTAITPSGEKYLDTAPKFEADSAIYAVKITLADNEEGYKLAGATLDVSVDGLLVKK